MCGYLGLCVVFAVLVCFSLGCGIVALGGVLALGGAEKGLYGGLHGGLYGVSDKRKVDNHKSSTIFATKKFRNSNPHRQELSGCLHSALSARQEFCFCPQGSY